MLKTLAPVLPVESIGPSLPFWTERLGFEVVNGSDGSGREGIAILRRGGAQLVLQTRDSIRDDDIRLAAVAQAGTPFLLVEVESIEEVRDALEGWPQPLIPLRATPYGTREIYVRSPEGAVLGFTEPARVGVR